jgi:hypothetical protein
LFHIFASTLIVDGQRPFVEQPLYQGFSKVLKMTDVAAISNRALSSAVRTRLGNRGYIHDFGKVLAAIYAMNGNIVKLITQISAD